MTSLPAKLKTFKKKYKVTTQTVTMTQTVANITVKTNDVVAVRYTNTYIDSINKVIQQTVAGEYINPGDDYSAEDDKVKSVCALIHTPEVIAAYKATQTIQG